MEVIPSLDLQEKLVTRDGEFSEAQTPVIGTPMPHLPLCHWRTVGPSSPTRSKYSLQKGGSLGSQVLGGVVSTSHSQTSSGLCGKPGCANQHVWHSGLGCKIYPAWQLVKLCNHPQLTETTLRCSRGAEVDGRAIRLAAGLKW